MKSSKLFEPHNPIHESCNANFMCMELRTLTPIFGVVICKFMSLERSEPDILFRTAFSFSVCYQVVIRCLPPTLNEEEFLKIVEPLPGHDFFKFVNADSR